MADANTCRCLIGGQWTEAHTDRFDPVRNPSTGETIAHVPMCGNEDVDRAVQAALKAFPAWRDTPPPDRARIMFRFHDLLQQHTDELARLVTREHGKTFLESKASVQRGIEMVEFSAGIPALLMGDALRNIAPDVDAETIRHPLGVVAGITPFNFPAMVPLWMYPVAITCGNCFILKPSERVPLSALGIAELLLEAGLPEGVFSIVHGDKACVDALLTHPGIKALSFVGSTAVARHVYQTGTAHGKRVQAAGGAKNHMVIMPDAELDPTISGMRHSAFGCAGERCMAGSLAVPVGDIADEVVARLCKAAGAMRVGRTDLPDATVDMGPLITQAHLERVRGYIAAAEREGADLVLDGRQLEVADAPGGFFVGPTIVDRVQPEMSVAREEIFGPVLPVVRVATLDEAMALGDKCQYANGAVIFTTSGPAARRFKHNFSAGMIGVNVGVPAPLAWFPFTGWKNSFFGDLHIQAAEGVAFYTQQRMIMTRWFEPARKDTHDPVWRPGKT
ncbi:MAG: CoA-acylating methylmalonate-semialdehyde dehydrogenase [Planctomycetes bacterium]|nr:CoA-acylating methylmalonate-semialdehyde dehydrogenase [Planctomycetota bacterium]